MIKYNRPYITGNEVEYIKDVIERRHLAGDGFYTQQCQSFFSDKFRFTHNYLTTSGTDALEMAAILANIEHGDEVIVPSYAFVSTANAFVLRGAKIVFADSESTNPNIDVNRIEGLITKKTKAIVPIHYAGVACDMDSLLEIARLHNIYIIEDAAHAIDSFYKERPLGSFGEFSAFSFHETKNIVSGEGGLIVVNRLDAVKRAEIIREKGTNRSAFFRGEVDKYSWVDIGSSFLSSEITAAFLFAQLEQLETIQMKRKTIWLDYFKGLSEIENYGYRLPFVPDYATVNGHIFYIVCPDAENRSRLIDFLKNKGVKAVFHYLPLHKSKFFNKYAGHNDKLINAEKYGEQLLRLPLFPDLKKSEIDFIIGKVLDYVRNNS